MTSGKTPRERQSGPASEPATDVTDGKGSVAEQSAEGSVGQVVGSAPETRRVRTGNAGSRRVSAAAAAAGAAAGSASTDTARAATSARTDNAVAAASAAAAAAVAAVSAAIAATNAPNAAEDATGSDAPAPSARKARAPKAGVAARSLSTARTKRAAAAAGAAVAAAEIAAPVAHNFEIATPLAPADIASITAAEDAPDSLAALAAAAPEPAAPETIAPSFHGILRVKPADPSHSPAITRAGSSEAVPEYEQTVEPLFSNEGIVRRSGENYKNSFQRIFGVFAGVVAALIGAGTALGHTVASHLPARTSVANALGSAAAAVAGVVLWPINKITRRGPAAQLVPVAVEYDSTVRRRRRAPILWVLFVGFFVALYGYGMVSGLILPAVAEGPSPSPTSGIAIVDPTVPATQTALLTSTPSATPSATKPVATTPATTPKPATAPTVKPPPKPTPKPTPRPTPRPTPVHTPTPVPTPTPTPVMFATITSATAPSANPGNAAFVVRSLPGANCYLTRGAVTGHGARNSTGLTVGTNGYAPEFDWGSTWNWVASGTALSFTATCTMSAPDGRSATSAAKSVTWP